MSDLLASDLIRWLLVAQTLLIMAAAIFLHTLHDAALPRPLALMGRGLLVVIGMTTLATVVNALSPVPPTPGAYVLAAGTLPVTVGALVLTSRAVRASRTDP